MARFPYAILMVKRPEPGATKTRLTDVVVSVPTISPERACRIAQSMLECVYGRLSSLFRGRTILAVTPDDAGHLGLPHVEHVVPQGEGTLGQRMMNAWDGALQLVGHGEDVPVAFFGMDSPDVPFEVLLRLELVLRGERTHAGVGDMADLVHDVADLHGPDAWVGPTVDGGYWTLASRTYQPSLLEGVVWGSENVCDQTIRNAESAGLCVERLRTWYDVDRPADLAVLRDRIEGSHEPMLRRLAQMLDQIGITTA